jgi:predicted small integral membrane protein
MVDRYLKSAIVASVALMALMYVAHNFANLQQAYDFFIYSTSHTDKEAYPVTLLPVPPKFLIVIGMVLVFSLELVAGLGGLFGAWKLWSLRSADAVSYETGKKWAKIAMGAAVVNWWGLFQGVAVAGYQLWQMPLGQGPFDGSWVYGGMAMMTLIYVSMREPSD